MKRALPLCCAAILALAIIASGAAWADPSREREGERESPPERISIERLEELAAQAAHQTPLGRVARHAALGTTTTLTWAPLGPAPIADEYWSMGQASGRISAVVVDPRDANVVYLAAAQGGVWKTTNGGDSWSPLTDGLGSLASGALCLDPTNLDVVYYATGEAHQSGDSFYGDGLFRSTDAGASWTKLASRDDIGSYVARIAVRASNPRVLYAGSNRGFVRSTDGGFTWSVIDGTNWCFDFAVHPTDSTVVYAAISSNGILKSTNGGASFVALGGGLPVPGGFQRINLALARSAPNTLYASFVTGGGSLFGMYKTTNGGTSWSQLTSTPNYLGTQGWYDNALIVDPGNANVCFAGGMYPYETGNTGIIRTTNGGASWMDVTIGVDGIAVHPDQHIFAFAPDGGLWIGNDGGVWRTFDRGAHWQNRNTNQSITQFYNVALHPGEQDRILGGTQDNGTLIYGGTAPWPQVIGGDGGYSLFLWNDPDRFYTTYVRLDPVYEWDENGFVDIRTGPWGVENDRASFAQAPLVGDPNTPDALLAGTHRIWRSLNSGASWDSLSGDLPGGTSVIRSVSVAPGAPNTIYTGTSNGLVYVTTDGVTWNPRSSGLPASAINDIEIHPTSPQVAYLSSETATFGRVWKTSNSGVSWSQATGDLPPGLRGLCLSVDYAQPGPTLYLGTDYGVWRSSDGGMTWEKEGAGLPSLAIYDLKLGPYGNTLVAATHGRGMWRGTRSMLAGRDGGPAAAGALALAAENPARTPTAIEFRLAHAGTATLDVMDVGGRRVRRVAAGDYPAGRHAATWDGRDDSGAHVAPGLYFYALTSGAESKVFRVALLR